MWGGQPGGNPSYYQPHTSTSIPPPLNLGTQPPSAATSSQQHQQQQQKHDVFVGNLAFSTTEEQLYTAFSEIGRIVKVRMVSDLETGKPRGFAFIEFEDPQAALSAIRNMNEYEINGRKIRVNFSNSSHLETLAGQLGMDLSHITSGGKDRGGEGKKDGDEKAGGSGGDVTGVSGSKAVASALKSMNKGEMYDVVAKLKEITDSNPEEARKLLTMHPQLPEAILYCMSELDMIKTPVSTSAIGVPLPTPDLPPPAPVADPRTRAQLPPTAPPPMAIPSDPRARPADPRAASRDPRSTASGAIDPRTAGAAPNFPPPPMMQPPPSMMQPPPSMSHPPPPIQQPPPGQGVGGVAGLDPGLIQQVMSLTPMQIAQLPPDKQQSILALRQQITGSGM